MKLKLTLVLMLLIALVGCSPPTIGPTVTQGPAANAPTSAPAAATHISAAATHVSQVPPTPLAVKRDGTTLRVEDPSTSLNGMTITQLAGTSALSQLTLGKLDVHAVPTPPEWVTPLSDVFVTQRPFDQDIELRFPLRNLPANVSVDDVHLHAYTEAFDVQGRIWVPVSITTSYEGTPEAPIIVIALGGLDGFAFWGYTKPQHARATRFENRLINTSFSAMHVTEQNNPTCQQQFAFPRESDPAKRNPLDTYICTTAALSVTITGFGTDLNQTHWGDVTKEQMVGWFSDAQGWFSTHHLAFDTAFHVSIERIDDDAGYVTTKNGENNKTVHLTNDDTRESSVMQGIAVHEYFHNAQARSGANDFIDSFDNNDAWITEGTARWFEDELYDGLNSYVHLEKSGSRIAEAGIHRANDIQAEGIGRPYQRFSFFKLLQQSCSGFGSNFKSILRDADQLDTTGINNLVSLFKDLKCDFGNQLGADNAASLEAALAYYNYATQFKDNISLLDSNEPDKSFHFDKPDYTFDTWRNSIDQWLKVPTNKVSLKKISYVPARGAFSFTVPAISGQVPTGKVAELLVTATQPITVSITSNDPNFIGINRTLTDTQKYAWFQQRSKPAISILRMGLYRSCL